MSHVEKLRCPIWQSSQDFLENPCRRAEGNKAAPHIDMKAEKWYILTSLT